MRRHVAVIPLLLIIVGAGSRGHGMTDLRERTTALTAGAAECEIGPRMGDYRGVSETQDKSSPRRPRQPATAPPRTAAAQPVKPVIPAAAAKRANASVIGMIIALVVSIAAFLPIVLMNPSRSPTASGPTSTSAPWPGNAADVAGFTPVTPETGDTFTSKLRPLGSRHAAPASPPGKSATSLPRNPSSAWSRPARPIPPGSCSRPRTPR